MERDLLLDTRKEQLMTAIRKLIDETPGGERLPSRSELAERFDVPQNWVSYVFYIIAGENLLYGVGDNTYVYKPDPLSQEVMDFEPTGYSQRGIEGFDRAYTSQAYDRAEIEIFLGNVDPVELAGLTTGSERAVSVINGDPIQEFFELKPPLSISEFANIYQSDTID